MREVFSSKLLALASALPLPLFAVGGVVRNYLIDKSLSFDVDLASPLSADEVGECAEKLGFTVVANYKRTGTVVFSDGERKYEFTSFRKEKYHGGEHLPYAVERTDDIVEDAKRRDFKCNAVYYDLKNFEFVDVLGGIEDIKNRTLDTVIEPREVFSHDGLRLLRLARFCGQLGFKPTQKVLEGARAFADNVKDISPERIFAELKLILSADRAYTFSDKNGHYTALKLLDQTRVLDRIIPELTEGRGMVQRADFHKFDVLEHSLKTVQYADVEARLCALLHDVGKPYCIKTFGNAYKHHSEGVRIAVEVLNRLRADAESIKAVKFAVKYHMIDMDCSMREAKVRSFIVQNYNRLDLLFKIKQADFKGSMELEGRVPTIEKWEKIILKMKEEGVPFSLKEVNVSAIDLKELGYEGAKIGDQLKKLWEHVVVFPKDNQKEKLIKMAKKSIENK